MSSENTNETDRAYLQYQTLVRQLQMLEQQEGIYRSLIDQYNRNLTTIENYSKNETTDEVIIPLSDLVYFKLSNTSDTEFMINMGAGILLPAKSDYVIDELKSKLEEIKSLIENIASQKMEIQKYIEEFQSNLGQREL
ncbi:MAG: prefoldin domain-containing protein [Candidatus Heimdallarchaeota archaeon]